MRERKEDTVRDATLYRSQLMRKPRIIKINCESHLNHAVNFRAWISGKQRAKMLFWWLFFAVRSLPDPSSNVLAPPCTLTALDFESGDNHGFSAVTHLSWGGLRSFCSLPIKEPWLLENSNIGYSAVKSEKLRSQNINCYYWENLQNPQLFFFLLLLTCLIINFKVKVELQQLCKHLTK